jgi:hypothetical protein
MAGATSLAAARASAIAAVTTFVLAADDENRERCCSGAHVHYFGSTSAPRGRARYAVGSHVVQRAASPGCFNRSETKTLQLCRRKAMAHFIRRFRRYWRPRRGHPSATRRKPKLWFVRFHVACRASGYPELAKDERAFALVDQQVSKVRCTFGPAGHNDYLNCSAPRLGLRSHSSPPDQWVFYRASSRVKQHMCQGGVCCSGSVHRAWEHASWFVNNGVPPSVFFTKADVD